MTKTFQGGEGLLLLTSRERDWWWSMQEVIPALEGVWTRIGRMRGKTVHRVCAPLAPEGEADLAALAADCGRIVITTVTAETERIALLLRRRLAPQTPMIIYLCGDATEGFHAYGPLSDALTEDDAFIVASEADAAATRQCFPRAHVAVAPFALVDQFKLNSVHEGQPLETLRLAYVGRVSEQKNLHTLLFALWILRTFHRPPPGVWLDVYGRADNLGSPNMGLSSSAYDAYLTDLARRLGIDHMVRWHGFRPRDWLFDHVHQQRHIFVSPTLHSDENFGSSVLASLVNANPVVTTAWGGHFGFEAWFPELLSLTPVQRTTHGPVVNPVLLASALFSAIEHAASGTLDVHTLEKARAAFSESHVAALTADLLDRPFGQSVPLEKSETLKRLEDRRARFGGGRQIFEGYDDPLARLFFEAYGMGEAARFDEHAAYLLAPWLNLGDEQVSIDDPHRGRRSLAIDAGRSDTAEVCLCPSLEARPLPKRVLKTLAAQGYAFPAPRA